MNKSVASLLFAVLFIYPFGVSAEPIVIIASGKVTSSTDANNLLGLNAHNNALAGATVTTHFYFDSDAAGNGAFPPPPWRAAYAGVPDFTDFISSDAVIDISTVDPNAGISQPGRPNFNFDLLYMEDDNPNEDFRDYLTVTDVAFDSTLNLYARNYARVSLFDEEFIQLFDLTQIIQLSFAGIASDPRNITGGYFEYVQQLGPQGAEVSVASYDYSFDTFTFIPVARISEPSGFSLLFSGLLMLGLSVRGRFARLWVNRIEQRSH